MPPLTTVRDAVGAIVAGVDSVEDPDSDSEAWRDDIARRMYWGSPVGCEPPLQLLALDPDYSVYGETYSYVS